MERAFSDDEIARVALIYNIPSVHTDILRQIPKTQSSMGAGAWISVFVLFPFAALAYALYLLPRYVLLAPAPINQVAAFVFPPHEVAAPYLYQGPTAAIVLSILIVTALAVAVSLVRIFSQRRDLSEHEALLKTAEYVFQNLRAPNPGCFAPPRLYLDNFVRLTPEDVREAGRLPTTEAFYQALLKKRLRRPLPGLVVMLLPLILFCAANAFAYRAVTVDAIVERPSFSLSTHELSWDDVERIDSGCERRPRRRSRRSFNPFPIQPYYRLHFDDGREINLASTNTTGIGADIELQLQAIDAAAAERGIQRTVNGQPQIFPPELAAIVPPGTVVRSIFNSERCRSTVLLRYGEARGATLAYTLHLNWDAAPATDPPD